MNLEMKLRDDEGRTYKSLSNRCGQVFVMKIKCQTNENTARKEREKSIRKIFSNAGFTLNGIYLVVFLFLPPVPIGIGCAHTFRCHFLDDIIINLYFGIFFGSEL